MILDDILRTKRDELAAARVGRDAERLQDRLREAPAPRRFASALRREDGRMALIAEIKKASPSAGVIQPDFDPVRQALAYERGGAHCLSVLTDETYFQGSLADLAAVRQAVALPCLRKDFVIDELQIVEARAAGADAILLIVAALSAMQIADFTSAANALGMSALVEVHTEQEMDIALSVEADPIGINARNLKTFEVDLGVVERVARLAPPQTVLVGESGIKSRADVERVRAAGVSAILVGETLMRAGDIAQAVRSLIG